MIPKENAFRKEREEGADELLSLVDLGNRGEHYPNQLSGGQQQRVAIARALSNDPDVILADEPTGNLDTKTGEKVLNFLEDLNKKGKTIIMVTHDPHLAQEHAKTIYWLKDGKVEKLLQEFLCYTASTFATGWVSLTSSLLVSAVVALSGYPFQFLISSNRKI